MNGDRETRETLDTLSGRLFLIGFFSTRLRNIPVFVLSAVFNVVSLAAYLIGYIVWYIATLCYPDHRRRNESWYGFAQFKEQFQAAALLGTLATIMCFVTPALIIPATWIYTISNTLWSIGEFHKKESPPAEDHQYSSDKQYLYFRYTLLVAIGSGITALAATIAFVFPTTAFLVVTSSTVFAVGLMAVSAYYWGKCFFGEFPPDYLTHSYTQLSAQLSTSLEDSAKRENNVIPEPVCSFSPLFTGSIPTVTVSDVDALNDHSHGFAL